MSAAQLRVLERMRAGETLTLYFDVWGGEWWELSPSGYQPRARTVEALIEAGAIEAGEKTRPFSGRHATPYRITTAAPSSAPLVEGSDG